MANETNDSEIYTKSASDGSIVLLLRAYREASGVFAIILSVELLLIVSGIFVNGAICLLMFRGKRYRRNTSNFFILHLSVTELFYRLVVFPIVVYFAVPTSDIENLQCKLLAFFSSTCSSATFASLTAIAVDRFQNIVHPLKSLKSKRKPHWLLVAVWLYAAVVSCPYVIGVRSVPVTELPEAKGMKCKDCVGKKLCDIPQDAGGQSCITLYFVLAFITPILAIAVLYTKIVVFLHERSHKGMIHKVALKSKSKAVRMLVVAVLGYAVALGPAALYAMLRSYGALNNVSFHLILFVALIAQVTTYTSSLANPLIYAYYSGDFRKELWSFCRRRKISSAITMNNTGITK